jgi:hypothetical protein
MLTLLMAGSIQIACESPLQADLARIVFEITEAIQVSAPLPIEAEAGPTVRDIPFYYDDLRPTALPVVPLIVTYDWRSPVVFDLP